ncbi:MAG: cytochrome b N-terminal domain-containing protein [Planctomycetota bacterium]|nr:cytochrome b N-terminal domain-containing protein [Planctomycetota bacterium]
MPASDAGRAAAVRSNFLLHLHPSRVTRRAAHPSYTWCMGGLATLAFLILTVTGVLLMFYYRPSPEFAYLDTAGMSEGVPFGRFLRNLHRWSAHAMVIFVWLHMLRVFLTGAYKPPRRFNWVVGVCLLVLTMLLSFTGYLLPWDQLSFWAVTVGSKMAAAAPVVGGEGPAIPGTEDVLQRFSLKVLLLGGSDVGPAALLRFYVLHCIVLPLACAVLMAVHFWRVRKDGFSGGL